MPMTDDANDDEPSQESIDFSKLLRLRSTLEAVRNETRDLKPDQGSTRRLASIQNTLQSQLAEALPHELEVELLEFASCCHENPSPTEAEIRIAQAQLSGWIEGLLNGVQLSIAQAQALAAARPAESPSPEPIADRRGFL